MQDFGGIEDKFNPKNGFYHQGFLYYGTGDLTDTYFIKDVHLYTEFGFTNKGKHVVYVIDDVKKGDLIGTSPIKGVAMKVDDPYGAFARVIEGSVRPVDKFSDMVTKAYVEFL